MPRQPNPYGAYCDSTRSSFNGDCYGAAVWVVYWADEEADGVKANHACAHHLHKLLVTLTPKAEFSREMFRVLPLDEVANWLARQENSAR